MLSPKTLFTSALLLAQCATATRYRVLDQFEKGTWFESIVVRPNGDLLVTQNGPQGFVHTIRNPRRNNPPLESLFRPPFLENVWGITPVEVAGGAETYVFIAGNASGMGNPDKGSFSAWTMTFPPPEPGAETAKLEVPVVKKVSDLSQKSRFLMAVTDIPGVPNVVLISDAIRGSVGYLDIQTGRFEAEVIRTEEMAPPFLAPVKIGINGIKVHQDYLYWTCSTMLHLFRVHINATGYPDGDVERAANLYAAVEFLDDFIVTAAGNIIAATNLDNMLVYIDVKNRYFHRLFGHRDSPLIQGVTSLAFGRTERDANTLYVTTGGGMAHRRKTDVEGAKVVAIDLQDQLN